MGRQPGGASAPEPAPGPDQPASVGRRLLQIEGERLALDPAAVDVDVVTFERLVAAGSPKALERAAGLYRGDLLEGLKVGDTGFEEWLTSERRRLRELAVQALTKLLDHQTTAWQDEAAIRTAGQLLALDPFREAAHRTLMRLYGRQGRREDALRQYRQCAALLKRELGVEPETETRRLYAEIGRQPASRERAPEAPSAGSSSRPKVRARSRLLDGASSERKPVTVLVAGVTEARELSVGREAERARQRLEPILERMMEAVRRYGGTVDRVTRDGIVALFGAPVAHEDHALHACQAALAIQAEDPDRPHGLAVRLGVHSGEVVVRSVGSDLRTDSSPVGQTVRLAERMKQLAPPGAIWVTGETLRLSEGLVQAKPRRPVTAKGFTVPVSAYELVGAGDVRTRFQAAALRGLSPLVGREPELEQLRIVLDRARRGQGEVVAAVGEPGLGKSRLVHELQWSPWVEGCRTLHAEAVSYGRNTAYLPVIALLKRYFEIADRDDTGAIQEKVARQLRALDHPALEDAGPAILWLLDALPATDGFRQLEPAQRRRRTLEAVKRLLLLESRKQPLVLVFEDLHWLDGETQTLLDSLVESVPAAAVLLVVSYRPEYRHSWSGKTYYRQLRVDPLPSASAESLLNALMGEAVELGPLKHQLLETAEGNPLFLEEGVRSLLETGILRVERGAYRLARPVEHLEIPATIHAILGARIDRLAPDDKQLLQAAAVIGKDVSTPLLRAVAERSEDGVRTGLERLQAAEFLYETRLIPDPAHTFKHALTQEVAYDSMLPDRRRALHARIGEAIERLHADRLAEHVERLAHHALRGGVWDKAVAYLRAAGSKASGRSINGQAIGYFEQALGALGHLPDARGRDELGIDIRLDLQSALNAMGRFEELMRYLAEAESVAERLGDQRRLARVSGYQTHMHWWSGDIARAVEAGTRAVGIARELGDRDVEVMARFRLGLCHESRGEYARALDHLRCVVAALDGDLVHERCGLPVLPAVQSRAMIAKNLAALGRCGEALEWCGEAIRLAEATAHAHTLPNTLLAVGTTLRLLGRVPEALVHLERALALIDSNQLVGLLPFVAQPLGRTYTLAGRPADALQILDRAMVQAQRMGQRRMELATLLGFGDAYLQVGRWSDALTSCEEGLRLCRAYAIRNDEPYALLSLGDIHLAATPPAFDDARQCYADAMARAAELGMRPVVAHCHLGFGRLYRRMGQTEQARGHLTTAATMYREMDLPFWLEPAEAELQELD